MRHHAGGALDVAIVLGSGLAAGVVARVGGRAIPYHKLHAPRTGVLGHASEAHVGTWAGKRVIAFAGRSHLYEGRSASDVAYLVRLAASAGARTIVLTNAAGALDASYARGDVMLIADHLNLTGTSPLDAREGDAFVGMVDAYAPHLRAVARRVAGDRPPDGTTLREGVYAGVRGPQYETAAESELLRRLGAHAVGMSTVLETIAARARGCDVLGLSLITNAIGPDRDVSHADVLAASREGGDRIATLVEATLLAL